MSKPDFLENSTSYKSEFGAKQINLTTIVSPHHNLKNSEEQFQQITQYSRDFLCRSPSPSPEKFIFKEINNLSTISSSMPQRSAYKQQYITHDL